MEQLLTIHHLLSTLIGRNNYATTRNTSRRAYPSFFRPRYVHHEETDLPISLPDAEELLEIIVGGEAE